MKVKLIKYFITSYDYNDDMFSRFINKGQNYWALIGWERRNFFLIEGILVIKRGHDYLLMIG